MIQAVIDIGSNTMRLAIYQIQDNRAVMVLKKKRIVGLAGYVRDGVMTEAGIDAAGAVLEEFHHFLTEFGIKEVTAFTTAALRNATNSRVAVAELARRGGFPIRVISGEEEAELDFLGAARGLGAATGLLVDIGGGSTELVAYENGAIREKVSLPSGSLSLRTGIVTGTLPSPEEAARLRELAAVAVNALPGFVGVSTPVIGGIGGTFKGGKNVYNALYGCPKQNLTLDVHRLPDMIQRFSPATGLPEEDAVLLMKAEPDRLHTLIPGLILAEAIARRFDAPRITYSDSGVREGFLYQTFPELTAVVAG
ncbi:MAG: exopolyphosphatase [Schwartzia sp.]|nr:exopolyphosphatase [Schwartzia sp. (in: firmicutes)]